MKTLKNTLVVTLLIAMVITLVSPLVETKAASYPTTTVKTLTDLKKAMKKSDKATIKLDLRNATKDSFTIPYIETSKNKKLVIYGKTTLTIKNKSYWKSITVNSKIKKYTESFTKSTMKKANTIKIKNSKTEFAVSKNVYVKYLSIYRANKITKRSCFLNPVNYLDKNTVTPTVKPTTEPTSKPTQTPTKTPTQAPTQQPTPVVVPTQQPVVIETPTQAPTVQPTVTTQPTTTQAPTTQPTVTTQPTITQAPTTQPTVTTQPTTTQAPTVQPTTTQAPTTTPEKPEKPDGDFYWDEEAWEWKINPWTSFPHLWASDGRPYLVYWDNGEYSSNPKPGFYAMINGKDVAVSESEIIYPSNWQKPEGWGVAYDPFASTTPSQTPTTSPEPSQEPTQAPTTSPEPTQEPVHTHTWVDDTISIPDIKAPSYHTESFNVCHYCTDVLGKSIEESDCGHGDEIDAHMKAHRDAGADSAKLTWGNGGTRYILDSDAHIEYIQAPIKKCECGEIDYSPIGSFYGSADYFTDRYEAIIWTYNKLGITKTPENFDSYFTSILSLLGR